MTSLVAVCLIFVSVVVWSTIQFMVNRNSIFDEKEAYEDIHESSYIGMISWKIERDHFLTMNFFSLLSSSLQTENHSCTENLKEPTETAVHELYVLWCHIFIQRILQWTLMATMLKKSFFTWINLKIFFNTYRRYDLHLFDQSELH